MAQIDFAFEGEPFSEGAPTYGTIDLMSMDYAFLGEPFVRGQGLGASVTIISGNIKRILKVDWPYVKTVINVDG
jgi:hypothetical protein